MNSSVILFICRFSATMAPKVEQLARKYMRSPVQVTIGSSSSTTTNVDITQIINMIKVSQKPAMLAKVGMISEDK